MFRAASIREMAAAAIAAALLAASCGSDRERPTAVPPAAETAAAPAETATTAAPAETADNTDSAGGADAEEAEPAGPGPTTVAPEPEAEPADAGTGVAPDDSGDSSDGASVDLDPELDAMLSAAPSSTSRPTIIWARDPELDAMLSAAPGGESCRQVAERAGADAFVAVFEDQDDVRDGLNADRLSIELGPDRYLGPGRWYLSACVLDPDLWRSRPLWNIEMWVSAECHAAEPLNFGASIIYASSGSDQSPWEIEASAGLDVVGPPVWATDFEVADVVAAPEAKYYQPGLVSPDCSNKNWLLWAYSASYDGRVMVVLARLDGDDNLWGGTGDDTLYGGDGADYLDGGTGIDRCTLGQAATGCEPHGTARSS